MDDTSLKNQEYKFNKLSQMTASERLEKLALLISATQRLVLAGIKLRHPQSDALEIKKRMAAMLLGAEFTKKNYSWDPSVEGY